jgi:hypothetical protein
MSRPFRAENSSWMPLLALGFVIRPLQGEIHHAFIGSPLPFLLEGRAMPLRLKSDRSLSPHEGTAAKGCKRPAAPIGSKVAPRLVGFGEMA